MIVTGRKPTIQSAETVRIGTSSGRHMWCNTTLRARMLAPGTRISYHTHVKQTNFASQQSYRGWQNSRYAKLKHRDSCSNSTTDWMYARNFRGYLRLSRAGRGSADGPFDSPGSPTLLSNYTVPFRSTLIFKKMRITLSNRIRGWGWGVFRGPDVVVCFTAIRHVLPTV